MKLKIADEKLDEYYLEWLYPSALMSNKQECDDSAKASGFFKRRLDYDTYILGFKAAEQTHQVTVDKLMQIIEMQKETLFNLSFLFTPVSNNAASIRIAETDKMMKELKGDL